MTVLIFSVLTQALYEKDPPLEAIEEDIGSFHLCIEWSTVRRAMGYQPPPLGSDLKAATLKSCCEKNDPDDFDDAVDLDPDELADFKRLTLRDPFLRMLAISPPILVKSIWKMDMMPKRIRLAVARAKGRYVFTIFLAIFDC